MAAEKTFENKIKKYLKDKGAWFLKYWGGSIYTRSGVPDLLICLDGYFLAVEVKGPAGNPSALQINNIDEINNCNGYGIILYPKQWDMFKNLVESLEKDDLLRARKIVNTINSRWFE